MGIRIPDLLEGILEATAAEQAAKARISLLRATLEAEGRRRLAEEGAAPSWNTPQLGKVRLDPPGEWTATVADPAAFGSYVAQHYPSEATAAVTIPAADLEDALQALKFIGVDVAESRVEVRSAWSSAYLAGLAVDVEEFESGDGCRAITVADPATGALVDGLSATRSPAKLVVTLDRTRRAAAIDTAKAEATALVEAAGTEDGDPAPDPEAIRLRRIELEVRPSEELRDRAKALELGSSGTKAELAERIARVEVAAGRLHVPAPAPGRVVTLDEAIAKGGLRPASELTAPERAIVERFEDAPDVLALVEDEDGAPLPPAQQTDEANASTLKALGGGIGDEGILPGDEHTLPVGPVVLEESPEQEAATLTPWDDDRPGMMRVHIAQQRADALNTAANRETLRRIARAKGINPGGTKADLIDRLVEAGITAEALT